MRRAVALSADVIAHAWDLPRTHRVIDLSPEGLRVAAGTRLVPGEHVIVCFTPPGWWPHGELMQWARVVRGEPRSTAAPATMGLELVDLPIGLRSELARNLRHQPPVRGSESEIEMSALSGLLTGAAQPYRWRFAIQ